MYMMGVSTSMPPYWPTFEETYSSSSALIILPFGIVAHVARVARRLIVDELQVPSSL